MALEEVNNIEVQAEEVKAHTIIRPFTEEQIDAHAAKCGGRRNLRVIPITTDTDEQFEYLVKKPSRAVMQALALEEQKGDKKDVTAIQKLMLGCVLEGDKEAYEYDGAIYSQLLKAVGTLVQTAKSDVKKL
jgi:alkanesulfonate monooxygenase SsuD/methylene tetrahydromethanopterin reductase-like flavin-dependent oxidoreductase (luciferase family)